MDIHKSTYVIAEAGVNHNGSLELALKLVEEASRAGANAVKFQSFRADKIVVPDARKAEYQHAAGVEESQYDMLKKLELSYEQHVEIIKCCKALNIEFLSTPFDLDSLNLLANDCNLPLIKLPSGEITNGPLLLEAARSGVDIILSTGMSTLGEIEEALAVLAFGFLHPETIPSDDLLLQAYASMEGQALLRGHVSLLHCTTEYPCPYDEVNLNVMDTLREAFGLRVGYSDHTEGIAVPVAAVAKGAVIIEKHFTLDRSLPGPDHKASLEPEELKQMIVSIRQIEQAMGIYRKFPTRSEMKNRSVVRKSIIAMKDIDENARFGDNNIDIKRPGDGMSPMKYWSLLGQPSTRSYKKNDFIGQ